MTATGAPRQGREDDGGAQVVAGRVVEVAAAGDQAEGGVARRAVHGVRRETGLEVFADSGHPEDSGNAVGQRHVDRVPGTERAKPEEDGGTPEAVDMTLDDRRPDLPGRRRVLVPGGKVGASFQRR